MAEHIMGMAAKKSIREVFTVVEKQLGGIEGFPKTIHLRSRICEATADRPDFKGSFESYSIRFNTNPEQQQAVKTAVEKHDAISTLVLEENTCVFTCPGEGKTASPNAVNEAIDAICSVFAPLPEVWRARGDNFRNDPISVELLFQAMLRYKASDLHLFPGSPPVFRVDNDTRVSEILGELSAQQITMLVEELADPAEWLEFNEISQTSFSYHQVGSGYSRVSAFIKHGAPHCTFRFLPETIPSFEDLQIPEDTFKNLAGLHHGLVLVTGMTGSGKSTTVAAIIDWINSIRTCHILTIENPVEYIHYNKKAIVSQRTTGKDVRNFNDAVTGSLRHDPDVIMIGEMRDPDTIRAAINAAATGHLVISTLHSNTASEVINRVISFFDPVERDLVRLQLRDCVRCIICQRLLPRKGGGRIPALEVMFNDIKPINTSIVAGDTDGIRIGMQQSVSHSFVFEVYLHRLYKKDLISLEDAQFFSTDQSILDQMVMGTYSIPRLDTIKSVAPH